MIWIIAALDLNRYILAQSYLYTKPSTPRSPNNDFGQFVGVNTEGRFHLRNAPVNAARMIALRG